jgi:hypothetical protein
MAAILDGGRGHRNYSRTIHAMFALNWLTGFRGLLNNFPIGSYVKTKSLEVLEERILMEYS